jgi:hypothetical protein
VVVNSLGKVFGAAEMNLKKGNRKLMHEIQPGAHSGGLASCDCHDLSSPMQSVPWWEKLQQGSGSNVYLFGLQDTLGGMER